MDSLAEPAVGPGPTGGGPLALSRSLGLRCSSFLWQSGVVCNLVSSLTQSLSSVLVKLLGDSLPVTELILVRSIFSLTCAFIIHQLSYRGRPFWGPLRHLPLLALRGTLGSSSMVCWYLSILLLPLADSIAILFLSPALTALLGWAVLGENLGMHTLLGCSLSLAGVAVVAQPPFLLQLLPGNLVTPTPWTAARVGGVLAGLGGALLSAAAYVTIRSIGKRVPTVTLSVWFFSVSFTTVIPAVLLKYPSALRVPTALQFLAMLGIGATSFVGQVTMSRSLQLIPASQAANLNLLQVPYGYVFGFWVFHDAMTWAKTAGGVLIVLGILEVNRDAKLHQTAKLECAGEETEALLSVQLTDVPPPENPTGTGPSAEQPGDPERGCRPQGTCHEPGVHVDAPH